MSSSFDSRVPPKAPSIPFPLIEVDGKMVDAVEYWKARAEKAEAKLAYTRRLLADACSTLLKVGEWAADNQAPYELLAILGDDLND